MGIDKYVIWLMEKVGRTGFIAVLTIIGFTIDFIRIYLVAKNKGKQLNELTKLISTVFFFYFTFFLLFAGMFLTVHYFFQKGFFIVQLSFAIFLAYLIRSYFYKKIKSIKEDLNLEINFYL